MATQAQIQLIRDLMVEQGHAHRDGHLRGSAKHLPHGPSMRERGRSVTEWATKLTPNQASTVIEYLKDQQSKQPGASFLDQLVWYEPPGQNPEIFPLINAYAFDPVHGYLYRRLTDTTDGGICYDRAPVGAPVVRVREHSDTIRYESWWEPIDDPHSLDRARTEAS